MRLLDLPDIVAYGCGPAPIRATTRAFATPSQNGRNVGTIYWHEDTVVCELTFENADGVRQGIPTLESGYEIPAAIVFERRGPWFRIRLKKGSAWVRRTDPTDFLPFPEILRDNLVSTMQTWDGTLRATSCDQTYKNVTDVEGWIPAYSDDRTPLAWFSSRGC